MNILLVSEDNKFGKILSDKLVFLRKDDKIILSSYEKALTNRHLADIVLIHEDNDYEKTIRLIKDFQGNKIIYIPNKYSADNILTAIDNGADDFVLATSEDFEFVIRIVNNIRYNSQKKSSLRDTKILEQQKIKDELTGLYNYEYSKQYIENVIDNNLIGQGMFLVISPSKHEKMNFSQEKFAQVLKTSVRNLDVITLGKGLKFYVFLPDTDLNGAICVLNKIKENSEFELCAGISSIYKKSFNKFEKDALKALSEALATNAEFVNSDDFKEETLDNWLGDEKQKGYKIFRNMFNKKLEKVITPIFYRLQKTYEEKLFDTEIEQIVDNNKCVFILKNKTHTSSLNIIYPGFSKIIISIKHEGLESPENREIQLQLSSITQSGLTEIIEEFIKEYKLCLR